MVVDFEKRYDIYNTKILGVETELEKYQFKIDKILKNIQNEINEIIQNSKNNNENIENNFNTSDINNKEENTIELNENE
jgi:hypothetical protein